MCRRVVRRTQPFSRMSEKTTGFGTLDGNHQAPCRVVSDRRLTPSQETVGPGFFGHAEIPTFYDPLRLPGVQVRRFFPGGRLLNWRSFGYPWTSEWQIARVP